MSEKNKIVEKSDLISKEVYEKERKGYRKKLVEFKKKKTSTSWSLRDLLF